MATYKEIKGTTIESITADPPTALAQGEMWYRSDTDNYKFGANIQSWASGGTMLTARENMGSGGTTNAMWLAGGIPFGGFEYYNGTAWSANSDMPTVGAGQPLYCQEGAGIQDALFCGHGLKDFPKGASPYVLHYNGSSWTADSCGNDRRYGAGFGTTAAAMVAGGSTWPNVWNTDSSNTWNGSSWSQEGTLPVGRNLNNAATGIETAGFILGGNSPAVPGSTDATSEWNSTAWANDGAYPSVVNSSMCGGPITAAISVGGNTGSKTTASQQYDGSTWSSYGATLPVATSNAGSATNAPGLTDFGIFGGSAPGTVDTTYELSETTGIKTASVT